MLMQHSASADIALKRKTAAARLMEAPFTTWETDMKQGLFTIVAVATLAIAAPIHASDLRAPSSARPITERTLQGTYVFAGRVLIHPVAAKQIQQNPSRLPVDCFAIGEFRFDGRGSVQRRVEIRCPATANLLIAGLGMPATVGEPTPQQVSIMGSTLTTKGSYTLNADGWGTFSDRGAFRLGPVPGNPTTSAGRFAVSQVRGDIAQELVVLIDQQSLQPPGAPMLVNSDIGASFVARRR